MFSEPGNETGHQEQMTTSQRVSADSAKHIERPTVRVSGTNAFNLQLAPAEANARLPSVWLGSQVLLAFSRVLHVCSYTQLILKPASP